MIQAWMGALLLVAATAPDFPTEPDEQDKLCEVIGEAPNLSVPPRDRLWFKENCLCGGESGCGKVGSPRFGKRLAAAKQALEQAKAEKAAAEAAAREAEVKRRAAFPAARAATARARNTFWRCSNNEIQGDCNALSRKLEKACRANGLRVGEWTNPKDECYGQF